MGYLSLGWVTLYSKSNGIVTHIITLYNFGLCDSPLERDPLGGL